MKRVLLGLLLGMLFSSPALDALRIPQPVPFQEWNPTSIAQLNDTLLNLWNISNGRYQLDVVTADPDGARSCNVGEMVLFDTGTDQLCVCIGGTSWKCVNVT